MTEPRAAALALVDADGADAFEQPAFLTITALAYEASELSTASLALDIALGRLALDRAGGLALAGSRILAVRAGHLRGLHAALGVARRFKHTDGLGLRWQRQPRRCRGGSRPRGRRVRGCDDRCRRRRRGCRCRCGRALRT